MRKLIAVFTSILLSSSAAYAIVTLPYTFQAGQSIDAAKVNANDQALRDGINNHTSATNPHNTTLSQILAKGNSCGSTSINFNGTQALSFEVENVVTDPACGTGSTGRLIYNTVDNLFKVCSGTSFVSIAGTGVNTLQSVLSAGNSVGSFNVDMNSKQLLNNIIENRTSDGASVLAGRAFFRTDTGDFKVCNGTVCTALGGAQGLSSVLGVSNSAGSTNIDFNGNQAVKMRLEVLASDPGTSYSGRLYYNSTSNVPKFYNGSSWSSVGNTQSLSSVLGFGNSAGSTNIDMNGNQTLNHRIENLSSDPGTGQDGRLWFNTVTKNVTLDDGSASRVVVTADKTQTLSNKTISGISNTISNVPDSALSSNVSLLNGAQTITAKKTFSSAPQIANIKTASGTTAGHIIPDGIADDTFVLANATQALKNKSVDGFSLASAANFGNYQISNIRVENRGTDPTPGNAGRLFYKTATGELAYDDGTNIRVLTASGSGSFNPWLITGNSGIDDTIDFFGTTDAEDLVFKTNGVERMRLTSAGVIDTNLGVGILHSDASGVTTSSTIVDADVNASAAINASKIADGSVSSTEFQYLDGVTSSIQTQLNGKQATGNYITALSGDVVATGPGAVAATIQANAIVDSKVSSSAAIARSKLASGTNYRILANDSSGVMSENAALTTGRAVFPDANGQLSGSANFFWDNTNSRLALGGATAPANTLDVQGVSRFRNQFIGDNAADAATGSAQTLTKPSTPVVRLTSGTLTSIGGIAAGDAGQFAVIMNTTGVSVTVLDEDSGSTAANRIRTGTAGAFTFQNNAAVFMVYDSTNSRWKMIGGAGGGRCVSTFSGTSITPSSGCTDQTFVYNGGSSQTFSTTGFGTISGLANGTRFVIMGSSDTNTLTINESDISDGRLQNGSAEIGKGQVITFEYNSTLARMVEISRNF